MLINYANPMAMSCWYLDRLGIDVVGLCYSVQGTSRMLARRLGVEHDEVRYLVAGINHQAWFLRFEYGTEDLYPWLRQVMARRHLGGSPFGEGSTDRGDHSEADRGESDYEGAQERVRTEIMAAFGYFHTESSHHASEYLPYFRKSSALVDEMLPVRWDDYQVCAAHDAGDHTAALLTRLKRELTPSVEYGATIINAVETDEPGVVYGNVADHGLIDNFPSGCCVEVPCLVDGNGVQPTAIGALPPQCAAMNRTNINVQELAVEAALTGERQHVYHAVMLDPLTGTILTLGQVREMTDKLFAAESQWLPDIAPAGLVALPDVPVRSTRRSGEHETMRSTSQATDRRTTARRQPV